MGHPPSFVVTPVRQPGIVSGRDAARVARQPRPEERFAAELLRRELGARFTSFDDGTRPAMPDGLFVLPDGREGALEVTTLARAGAMEFESLTLGTSWSERVGGVEWYWAIWVAPGLDLVALRRHLGVVLRACEKADVHELEVGVWAGDTESHRWLRDQKAVLHGFGSDSGEFPGLVQLIPGDFHATFLQDDVGSELGEWLEAALATPALVKKLEKLAATGRSERHLFLRIHESAPSAPLLHALCFSDQVPAESVVPSHGLSGLWIVPRWGTPLRWLAGGGWARFEIVD